MPLARIVAPSEGSGKQGGRHRQRRGRCCAECCCGRHREGRLLHHFGGGFGNGIGEARGAISIAIGGFGKAALDNPLPSKEARSAPPLLTGSATSPAAAIGSGHRPRQ